ncbi:MAG: B12-binding domain-containing radical SAM protein [Eubacterium sp.]|nr:B12-binding domain-containing radical SAM protein [Eubacterium sp.]
MNVLLINPSTGYYSRALFNPLGLLSIGSHLKRIGHNVKLVDRCVSHDNLKKLIAEFKPGLVGVSLMSSRGLKDAIKVSKTVHSLGIPVAWGGAMPSMQHEICLENDYVDYVMFSEGEFTFEELIEVIEGKRNAQSVLSLCYKENGEIKRNADRPFADLADMPLSDYSLVDVDKYLLEYLGCERMIYMYSSKGCPCSCTFCSNNYFHKCTHRKRPNEYVIEELKYLTREHGVDGVFFSDELWVVKREDALDFCRRLKENDIHIRFGIQTRIGLFTKEDFQVLYDAGCRWAFFGIETGSREMMKRINKSINYDRIIPTYEELREIGITSIASFIIGFPGETVEQVKETVELLKVVNANLTPIYHFTPLPGTQLYNEVVASGQYKPAKSLKDLSKFIATETLGQNLSEIPSTDLKVIRSCFEWRTFTRRDALAEEKAFEFAAEVIKSGLHAITQKGPVFFLIDGFKAFKEFSHVFWYSHAYPKIKKKYEL